VTHILPLSARSAGALTALARKYRAFFDAEGARHRFADVCYTASARRAHHECRLTVVTDAADAAKARLDAFLDGTVHGDVCSGEVRRAPTVAFVFSGQGSQWPGMGRDLLARNPVFAEAVASCDESARDYIDWSLVDAIENANIESRLADIDVLQPVLFSIQVGVARVWQSWGIVPAAVVGHSMGEIAAAHIAGALGLNDALRIVCSRSRLLKRHRGEGAMGVVGLPADRVSRGLARCGDRVSIAAINSPASTVISGDVDAVVDLLDTWERDGVSCHRVSVDVASHSAHIDSIAGELRELLRGLKPRAAQVGIVSTVTGDQCDGEALDADYWFRNLRAPVQLSAAVEKLVAAGHAVLLEVSPHPVLTSANHETVERLDARTVCLGSLRRDDGAREMLKSLATLYTLGARIDWNAVHGREGRCVSVPSYPWQRQRFVDDETDDSARQAGDEALGAQTARPHTRVVAPATQPGTRIWQTELRVRDMPYLLDHRVQGLAVLPAATFLDVVVRASTETFGSAHALERVVFSEPLLLSATDSHIVQIVFSDAGSGHAWQLFSQRPAGGVQRAWTLHASGHVQVDDPRPSPSDEGARAPSEILARCVERVDGSEFYRLLRDAGLDYGVAFRRVEEVWRRDTEAIARIDGSESAGSFHGFVHPVVLDACFQALFAAGEAGRDRTVTHLPIRIERLRFFGRVSGPLWSHARVERRTTEEIDRVEGDVTLLDERGVRLAEVSALTLSRLDRSAAGDTSHEVEEWTYEVRWERLEVDGSGEQPPRGAAGDEFWLVLPDEGGSAQQLQAMFVSSGQACEIVGRVDDLADVLRGIRACRGIVDCRGLAVAHDTADGEAPADAAGDCDQIVHLVSTLSKSGLSPPPPLWLITRGTQATSLADRAVGFAKAVVWGLGRVVMEEHPELRCRLVDLGVPDSYEETHALFQLLMNGRALGREDQIALRPDGVHVARLVRSARPPISVPDQRSIVDPGAPVRLELTTPGDLDSLTWRRCVPRAPDAGEVLIDVHAAGLNFKDVLLATGVLSPFAGTVHLGFECAGRIAAVGPEVDRLCVGDDVIAFAARSLGSVAITRAEFVAPKPPHLTFEQAAGIPVAFVTAHHALHCLARLRAGERVLIHTASGGVGLAAVQFAQQEGAEIFATAGSEEKRSFLAGLGLRHVMDSRRHDFAAQILNLTSGQGVDVVLNSLAGEFLHDNFSVLRSGGRFLELAKSGRDARSAMSAANLGDNRAFFAVDLGRLLVTQAEACATMLHDIGEQFARGRLQPLPIESFPPPAAADACRQMSRTTHIGKVVVSAPDPAAFADACSDQTPVFRGDASYLITGGAGAIGHIVARWMVARGARHVVLAGRKKEPEDFASTLDAAAVSYISCDVSRRDEVARLFDDIERSLPPLRGIVHAAGLLDDSILLHQDRERLERVMAPKIAGAWNLHRACSTRMRLDFFVLFSSAASVLGSPGQGNYTAANAFLDALAWYRRGAGLPALSISWGPWSGGGLAANAGGLQRAVTAGLRVISPRLGMALLDHIFCWPVPHVAAMAFDMPRWRQARSFRLESPLLSTLTAGGGAATTDGDGISAASIMALPDRDRVHVLEQYVAERLARVLRLPSAKVDTSEPVNRLGLDSLVAVELRNRIARDLGVDVPVLQLLSGVNISELAGYLVEQVQDAASATARPQDSTGQIEQILQQMDSLSDEEARALAADLLHSNVDWDRSR